MANAILFRKTILFTFIFLTLLSCKKVVTKAATSALAPRIAIKIAVGTGVVIGAYIVTEQVLNVAFEEAEDTDPIEPTFFNRGDSDINLSINIGGDVWMPRIIRSNEELSLRSGKKGIIGLKYDENVVKIDQTKMFVLNKIEEVLNIYGH